MSILKMFLSNKNFIKIYFSSFLTVTSINFLNYQKENISVLKNIYISFKDNSSENLNY